MSLATEETKTVWKDIHGKEYDNQADAEYNSVRAMISEAADGRWMLSPYMLIEQLKKHPEAKQWLLDQIGAGAAPIVDMSMAFGHATRLALKGEAVHALDQLAEMAIKRVMAELQAEGYQLIKK